MARNRKRKLYNPKSVKCKICHRDMKLNEITGHKCPPKLCTTNRNGSNKSNTKRSVVVARYKKSFLNSKYTLLELEEDNARKGHKYAVYVKK